MGWSSLELAGLIAAAGLLDVAAGTGLSYLAGYPAPHIPTAGGVRRTDIRVGVRLIY
jgi:hypothetical protein